MKLWPDTDRPTIDARDAVTEMIELQRRIFDKHSRIIEANEARSRGFTKYRDEYRNAISGYSAESGFGALCDAIAQARIAFVADYHTLKLAQKTFVKLIKGVMHQVDNVCLALEFVNAQYQSEIHRYLKGRIKERTFLRRIQYGKTWPYDIWPNFRPIFELAIDRGIPIVGIDTDPTTPLVKRDRFAAEIIADFAKRYEDATVMVLTGQMHVAPAHLPAAVDQAFIKAGMLAPERVIVYQNSEEIYWQLARARREGVEVVKVSPESYCVNNTPPLVQQLSYLHWVQFDHELLEYPEIKSTVKSLMRNLGRFLDLPFTEAVDRVRVYMPGDLDLLTNLDEGPLPHADKERILSQVEAEESACIPSLGAIYLATLSVNHAAEESAHYLRHSVCRGSNPECPKDLFYYQVINEALGFFSSKVINPKRKADHIGKLRQIVASARKRRGRQTPMERAAHFALDHLALEAGRKRPRPSIMALSRPAVFNAASRLLGYILGDRLYYGLTSGAISKMAIREIFLNPLDQPGQAYDKYLELSRILKGVKIPRRI